MAGFGLIWGKPTVSPTSSVSLRSTLAPLPLVRFGPEVSLSINAVCEADAIMLNMSKAFSLFKVFGEVGEWLKPPGC